MQYYICIDKRHNLEQNVFKEMMLCSLGGTCTNFQVIKVLSYDNNSFRLDCNDQGYTANFPVQGGHNVSKHLSYPIEEFNKRHREIMLESFKYFMMFNLLLIGIAYIFARYTLKPLRRSLEITQEFSKDIIHDLQTPLAVIRLNASRLNISTQEEKKLSRILGGVDTLETLGSNLKSYLEEQPLHNEDIDLFSLLNESIEMAQRLHPKINFDISGETFYIFTDKTSFKRIIDNLLSNAGKYNVNNGYVNIRIDKQGYITIEDSGIGIKHPEKIFSRFYKEHERGLGIGLHIVQKLCDTLGIIISVKSKLGYGSRFTLNIKNIIH